MRLILLLLLTGSAFADEKLEQILDEVTIKVLREAPMSILQNSRMETRHIQSLKSLAAKDFQTFEDNGYGGHADQMRRWVKTWAQISYTDDDGNHIILSGPESVEIEMPKGQTVIREVE